MATRNTSGTAAFEAGDVVQRLRSVVSLVANTTISSGTVGTICRVVNPGRSYMVRFADVSLCVLAFHSSLASAPPGTEGPECEADC